MACRAAKTVDWMYIPESVLVINADCIPDFAELRCMDNTSAGVMEEYTILFHTT